MQNSMSTATSSSSSSEESMTDKPASSSSSSSGNLPSTFTSTFGLMKDRATMARNTMAPQLQNMKAKTSKKLERYQPSIDRVRSSASAAASMGRERMQPALSRVKEGSTHGWSMLKTKIASAAPVAEKFQNMGMHVVHDFLGESAIDDVRMVDDPARASCRFLEHYKHGYPDTSKIPRIMMNRRRSSTGGGIKPTDSAAAKCLATPYILGNILLFCGTVETLGRMALMNQNCRSLIKSERRLWRFCVRFGEMPAHVRFTFWEHAANVSKVRAGSELDFETYLLMAKSKGECTELILTDVRRTYGRVAPHKRALGDQKKEVVYDTEQELINQLSDLLHALAGKFPDVGYCQGMDYIAAHVLDHVKKSSEAREAVRLARKAKAKAASASGQQIAGGSSLASPTRTSSQAATRIEVESAFWVLVALFENYGLRQTFGPGLQKLQLHCFQTQTLFELSQRTLHDHLETQHVVLEMFIVGWFQTLFLYLNVLPRETLDKIWDIFVFEHNWKIILRAALALMQVAEPHIVDKPIDQVMQFLNTFSTTTTKAEESEENGEDAQLLAPEVLVKKALAIKVTNTMLTKLAKQHTRNKKTNNAGGGAAR